MAQVLDQPLFALVPAIRPRPLFLADHGLAFWCGRARYELGASVAGHTLRRDSEPDDLRPDDAKRDAPSRAPGTARVEPQHGVAVLPGDFRAVRTITEGLDALAAGERPGVDSADPRWQLPVGVLFTAGHVVLFCPGFDVVPSRPAPNQDRLAGDLRSRCGFLSSGRRHRPVAGGPYHSGRRRGFGQRADPLLHDVHDGAHGRASFRSRRSPGRSRLPDLYSSLAAQRLAGFDVRASRERIPVASDPGSAAF